MITAGTRLGPYEILEAIGSGGMGEVYRAHDPRMARDVAIKVLPRTLTEDSERLRRFEQEARSAGLLNHNNLLTIYELGEHEGAPYIVTELLEGETLRERIQSGPIAQRKAVEFAIQIIRGLAAAHDKGIVHRDLKPENLFLTRDGRVKILDFGLAKLTQPAELQTDVRTAQRITNPGAVMGTVGYMSPEQVRGQSVDFRSDLFSFGTVLYEMLTGSHAFQRDTSAETMTAILREDPPEVSGSGLQLSPALDRIVRHCLEKNPGERFQSARDLIFDLESLSFASNSSPQLDQPDAAVLRPSASRRILAAAGALLLLALITTAFFAGKQIQKTASPPPSAAPRRFSQITYFKGVESFPALSPDGKSVAFVSRKDGNDDIFLQRTDGRNAINLTADHDGTDTQPAFSPDGNSIAFYSSRSGGGIFVMGATGESVRRLTEFGSSPSWTADGKSIVFDTERISTPYVRQRTSELWSVDLATSKTTLILKEDGVQPSVSPHMKRIAYWGLAKGGGQRDVSTISLSGSAEKRMPVPATSDAAVDWNPFWSPDGKWLYFGSDREGSMNLWRVAIDEESGKILSQPERALLPAAWAGYFSASPDGKRIAFSSFAQSSRIEEFDLDPASRDKTPKVVLAGSLLATGISLSPDGKLLTFTAAGPQEDLYIIGTDGKGLRQLTNDAAKDRGPVWWPDGSQIAVYSNRGGRYEIWSIRPDGSGLRQLTATEGLSISFPVPSADGKRLFVLHEGLEVFDMTTLPARGVPVRIKGLDAKTELRPSSMFGGFLAGDVRQADRMAPSGIVVMPLDNPVVQHLTDFGGSPHFLPGGRAIAFMHNEKMELIDVQTRKVTPLLDVAPSTYWDVGSSAEKQSGNATGFAISADLHLYMIRTDSEADIWVATIGDDGH